MLVSNSTRTPTAVPQRQPAGNVGVLELTLATSFAVTSTLLTAEAREGGGNPEGVAVAALVLPSRFASTPTSSSSFVLAMQLGDVGVPDVSPRSSCAGTSTATAALRTKMAVASGPTNDFATNFTATLATDQLGGTGGAGRGRGAEEGWMRAAGGRGGAEYTRARALSFSPPTASTPPPALNGVTHAHAFSFVTWPLVFVLSRWHA